MTDPPPTDPPRGDLPGKERWAGERSADGVPSEAGAMNGRRAEANVLARRLATPEGLAEARRRQARGEYPGLDPAHPPGHEPAAARVDEAPGDERPGDENPGDENPGDDSPGGGARDGETAEGPRPISIWQPRSGDGGATTWVRPEPSPLGDHYARRREIGGKPPGVRRVCFFGESAAAGYLYAPHLTPAAVLQAQLHHLARGGAPGPWEVVDLARTNERCATLAATVEAAAQLQPDHLVVFTGNNWSLLETPHLHPRAPSFVARQELARHLSEGAEPAERPLAAARAARREMALRAADLLERLAAVSRQTRAAVTLVLPEVNLDDWETREPPVSLPGDDGARWFALHRRALAALAAGDGEAAERLAWEMVELDGGTGPTPFRLLARSLRVRAAEPARPVHQAADLLRAAADAARSEVDATHPPLLASVAAPRAGEAVHRILAGAARRHGFSTVDLRRVFAEWTGSPLPGRRLFLDYCHLTAEGAGVAMAAVAQALLAQEGAAAGERRAVAEDLVNGPASAAWRPSAAARATAHLGAAVHTAHRHLPVGEREGLHRELLVHHCRIALDADPEGTTAALLDLAEVRTAQLPALLTEAHRRNFARPAPLLLQHGWRWPHLDGDLLRAAATVLAQRGQRRAVEDLVRLVARRRVGREPQEWLHPPHALVEPGGRFQADATAGEGLAPRALLRLPWPEVAFDLVAEAGERLLVEAVLRRPGGDGGGGAGSGSGAGEVAVFLDGRPVGTLAAGGRWTRSRVEVAVAPPADPSVAAPEGSGAAALRLPIHRLSLRWPDPPPEGPDPWSTVRADLETGRAADVHAVPGELASLRVRTM